MKWISFLFFLATAIGYSQTIKVNGGGENPAGLVNSLIDNACVEFSNASVSSAESVAFFTNGGGKFPISEGVIIRSGNAKLSEGKYTGEGISSQVNELGDQDLQKINSTTGPSHLITDVAFLEFDFVPHSSDFNFNFLFASNEYGEWQCVSSDVFGFLLTDLTTGETSNLAVIPDTNIPVSVRTIKDNAYNGSCQPDNAKYFSNYQVDNPSASTVNMRGYTQVMNASAELIPGKPYRIRLVIGDSNDANYDSAIFLEAGSFNANVDLGEDRSLCQGDEYTLSTGLDTSRYAHSWTFNGKVLQGETDNSLQVTEIGTYGVKVTKNGTKCLVTDEIVIQSLQVIEPKDLSVCENESGRYSYDLSQNDELALEIDSDLYDVYYYSSHARLTANTPIPTSQLQNFSSSGNQMILMNIFNTETKKFCEAVYNFQLKINNDLQISQPDPIIACLSPSKSTPVDLTQVERQLLGGKDPASVVVSYFNTSGDAKANQKHIFDPQSFYIASGITSKTVWARVENDSLSGCFSTISFEIHLNELPPVDELEDVIECSQYILPKITHGNYFTGSGGTGTPLFAGDIITKTGTYYIFNGPNEFGCTNESSFLVTIVETYSIPEKYCGSFSVPDPPEGAFYTRPDGPTGGGTLILPGTVFTENMTIHYYAEVDGVLCRNEPFPITILPLPPVDQPVNVVTCGSYTLPPLQFGKYFSESGGMGNEFTAGDVITSSTSLFVFNRDSSCTNEHEFKIQITPSFEDILACGSYELPVTEFGSFFTAPGGQGAELKAGSILTTSQTIYFHADINSGTNCEDKTSFNVTVVPIPEVDQLENVLLCEGQAFTLPKIANGSYFTEPDRGGNELFPGQLVYETTTIYVNNMENSCTNESSFLIDIRPLPEVENFTDFYNCSAYTLPSLNHGRYFSGQHASGTEFFAGDVITETTTLYVYNEWPDFTSCYNENAFTIYVEGIDVGEFEDIVTCDAYYLPALSAGNYFTESGGKGNKLKAGTAITSTQEIFVYSSRGTRFVCTDEENFMVTVSTTPKLPASTYFESCGSYTLTVPNEYDAEYFWKPGGNPEEKLSSLTIATPGNYKVYLRATAKDNPECVAESEIDLVIYPLLDLPIKGGTICRNPDTGEVESEAYLTSGLNPREFEVSWYFGGELIHTGPDYSASEAGDYTVKTTKLQPEKGAACNYKETVVTVAHSAQPTIRVELSEPFDNVAVITVSVDKGFGDYEYRLDNGEFQPHNQFHDVSSGNHTVTVRGASGNCGGAKIEVQVLKFPKYFTPNGDGFNDTWTIPDIKNDPKAEIHVFDRYGKLLKVFPPSQTWDGLLHGKEMPSDDYWFRAVFEHDGILREYKSHFTLKRI